MSWFPKWQPYQGDINTQPVATNEYLPASQSIMLGIQHVLAMFGATVLAPLLMGFDANLAIMMSGICTILFFIMTGGRVPSYLGSSFAFIGVVAAATAHATGSGANPNLGVALGGIIACGVLYAVIGFIVMGTGTKWIEKLMPPVVTGAVVMIIGLNLAPVTVSNVAGKPFELWMTLVTVLCMGMIAVFSRGFMQRLLLLLGLVLAYIIYAIVANGFGLGAPIDFGVIGNAAWFGVPNFSAPVFDVNAMLIIAPVAFILVAENLGHIKAVGAMTGENLTPYLGRAFVADGVATALSAGAGGTGTVCTLSGRCPAWGVAAAGGVVRAGGAAGRRACGLAQLCAGAAVQWLGCAGTARDPGAGRCRRARPGRQPVQCLAADARRRTRSPRP